MPVYTDREAIHSGSLDFYSNATQYRFLLNFLLLNGGFICVIDVWWFILAY
jgi:hypothetical protein